MADATGYVVNATATNGHAVSCSSATATCTLTDLLCSETYTATISARGSQCDSPPSSSTNITTRECASLHVWKMNFLPFHCERPTSMPCSLFSPLSPSDHIEAIHMWLQHGSAQVDRSCGTPQLPGSGYRRRVSGQLPDYEYQLCVPKSSLWLEFRCNSPG